MKQGLVLITGATGGMGFATASAARARDIHIIGTQKNKTRGEKLQALIEQDPLSHIETVDLSIESDIEEMCRNIKEKEISLSWVIHAAGMIIDERKLDGELSSEQIRECFQVNTIAPMHISNALEQLISPEGGVIFLGSTAGLWGNSGFPIYSSTKSALHNFGLSLSRKWSGTARKSIVVAPGATNTQMRERVVGDAASSQSPDVVAQLVLDIIAGSFETTNGDILLVKNGTVSKIAIAPTQ